MTQSAPFDTPRALGHADQELVDTLFRLGRRVTSVLDPDELLPKIPELIARVVRFEAFSVYLLDPSCQRLRIAYAIGYPPGVVGSRPLKVGEGLVGIAVSEERPVLANDVTTEPGYVELVPGMQSELVVPLRHQAKIVGALNLLGANRGQFSERDQEILRQFGAHVAVALVNARLFTRERKAARAFETLTEIGREVSSILDLEALFTRIAKQTRRVIDYRTFGIFLLNERSGELELRLAVKYGEKVDVPRIKLGSGLVGHAALHKQPVLVSDVSTDPRYIKIVEDVRSELAIPMLLRDRCIGVFDLESPELGAFDERDKEVLTVLASQAAVAIENARLYQQLAANEDRLEREVNFAQRVQMGLLPAEVPSEPRGLDVGVRFASARELGGDFYDFVTPTASQLAVVVGDVSGKGAPAALYSAFAGELVRGRTFRGRYAPDLAGPGAVLASMNTILYERQLEPYFCTLAYALFDTAQRSMTLANAGLPYPYRCTRQGCGPIELPGVPLGPFAGSSYDEISFDLEEGDVYVFASDGIHDAEDASGRDFTVERLRSVIEENHAATARTIADAIFAAVLSFRGGAEPNDDMTVVVVKLAAD